MIRNISAIKSNLYGLVGKRRAARLGITCLMVVCFLFSVSVHGDEKNTTPAAAVWYQELAAQGNVDAKFSLGMMSETGWGVPVDLEKAVRWYREAAKEEHAEAQLRLGMLYYLGLGSRQSKLKGESWIRKSAKQGHEFAGSLNKQLFAGSDPGSIDTVKVIREVRKIYLENENNAVPALKRLVRLAKQETKIQEQEKEKSTIRERREERKETQVAAVAKEKTVSEKPPVKKEKIERIESVVPEFVGKETVEENRTLAKGNIETIRSQAKQGQASAQYNLGRMYELGIKLPVNKKEALNWYEKAAKQGFPDAEYRLALALLYGISTEKDETLGRQWLASAAKHGHQVASNLMKKISGDEGLLRSGQSVVVDWYLERAIVGDADAALSLGKIYEYGWGAIPDAGEANKWYQKASVLGSQEANKQLQQLATRIAQDGRELPNKSTGIIAHSALPSNWIAYLIAILVGAFIIFSPALLKKQKQKSELHMLDKNVNHREEPPFI